MSVLLVTGMVLFTIGALMHLLIGVLTPMLVHEDSSVTILFVSTRTDTALYGAAPRDLVAADPHLGALRRTILMALSGLLVGMAVLELALIWFGLRTEQGWALAALAIAGVAMLPFWYLVFRPYRAAGIPLALSDLPPFIWVPALVLLPATVLSMIGLQA